MSHFTDFTGYVVFIITSFLAGAESADQCLPNSKSFILFFWRHNEYKIVFFYSVDIQKLQNLQAPKQRQLSESSNQSLVATEYRLKYSPIMGHSFLHKNTKILPESTTSGLRPVAQSVPNQTA